MGKDFDKALETCFQLFGGDDKDNILSQLRDENNSDNDEYISEEEKEEIKMPVQEHRRVRENYEEEKVPKEPP
jgi:hypothetical protein